MDARRPHGGSVVGYELSGESYERDQTGEGHDNDYKEDQQSMKYRPSKCFHRPVPFAR